MLTIINKENSNGNFMGIFLRNFFSTVCCYSWLNVELIDCILINSAWISMVLFPPPRLLEYAQLPDPQEKSHLYNYH